MSRDVANAENLLTPPVPCVPLTFFLVKTTSVLSLCAPCLCGPFVDRDTSEAWPCPEHEAPVVVEAIQRTDAEQLHDHVAQRVDTDAGAHTACPGPGAVADTRWP